MPELPEVESLRLSLKPWIINQKILKVQVLLPKLVSSSGTKRKNNQAKADQFETELIGKTILGLNRKNKNLILELSDDLSVLIHLKMTGQLVFSPSQKRKSQAVLPEIVGGGHPIKESHFNLPHKNTHIIFDLSNGQLFYNDVRQFGYLLLFEKKSELTKHLDSQGFGLEPLSKEFNLINFKKVLKGKKGNLKTMLLSQKIVAGLGNIYADEACFESGILPTRTVNSLSEKEIKKLFLAIKRILKLAVKEGGSSVANYLLADGSKGNYAKYHLVYQKAGQPCSVCQTILEKTIIGSRTTVYCPVCQK